MTSTFRTARCGSACRVVWQGRGSIASYADFQSDRKEEYFTVRAGSEFETGEVRRSSIGRIPFVVQRVGGI